MLHIIPHYNRDLTEPWRLPKGPYEVPSPPKSFPQFSPAIFSNDEIDALRALAAEVIIQRAAQSKAAELEKLAEELGYDLMPKVDTAEPAADY